jgi:hypothetical protein
MKYVVEMGSDVMIYISGFIKFGSGIQKLVGRFTGIQKTWKSHKLETEN